MCLTPKSSRLKTAKEDIVVIKFLNKRYSYKKYREVYVSPYQGFEYPINKLVKVDTRLGGDKSARSVYKGLHAYLDYNMPTGRIKFKAIIPKGSIYKIGMDYDIVSNQLIVKRLWKDSDTKKLPEISSL